MIITNINQLDNYTLNIGDKIIFSDFCSYEIDSLKKVSIINGTDIWKSIGVAMDKANYISFYGLGKMANGNRSFGSGGEFPHNGINSRGEGNPFTLTNLTKLVSNVYKIIAVREYNPVRFNTMLTELSASETSTYTFIDRLYALYNDIPKDKTLLTNKLNNHEQNKTIVVPRKAATITTGKRPTGHGVQGRIRKATITIGHLSFQAISS